jgi:hypothetical protein
MAMTSRVGPRGQPLRERGCVHRQLHVGIQQQQVVEWHGRRTRAVQRRVARLGEIDERKAMQLAWNIARGEEAANELLGAVGGSGIANDPAGYIRRNGRQTALKIRRLVLDDHIQAKLRRPPAANARYDPTPSHSGTAPSAFDRQIRFATQR